MNSVKGRRTRIKNTEGRVAAANRHDALTVPYTIFSTSVCECLSNEVSDSIS